MPKPSSIRFPRMHLAASVSNRILNIADGVPNGNPRFVVPPVLPDVQAESEALTVALETPPEPTELPAGADGAVVGAALGGQDLATAAVSPLLPGV